MSGGEQDTLVERFQRQRGRLVEVAYRLLGSYPEAEDAVQEAWLRLGRVNADQLTNLDGWLTTVVARISLNMLRSRRTRGEQQLKELDPDHGGPDVVDQPGRDNGSRLTTDTEQSDPESEALLADAVGSAMMVVLDALSPTERLAFVLHDMFGVSFDEVARIVDRTPAAARQLASRARRRVRAAPPPTDTDLARRRRIVEAFLGAARGGDFEALLTLLDPEASLRADAAAVQLGSPATLRGATRVAEQYRGSAQAARPALIDGEPGLVWAPGGRPRAVIRFVITDGRITELDLIADPRRIAGMALKFVRLGT